jgi:hypothetical protein
MDDILNRATNNRWQDVVEGYAKESRGLERAKAAARARGSFWDAETGRVLGVEAATDIPKITEARLGAVLNSVRGQDKRSQLSAQALRDLEGTLGAVRAQNIVQRLKRTATAGGGSDTASNQQAADVAKRYAKVLFSGDGGTVSKALAGVEGFARSGLDDAMARALQNPDEMLRLLEARVRAGRPLSSNEQVVLGVLRGMGGAGTATN